eukprot:gnl/TRDRNA2_/TRDRNA2_33103_c0_seq1.p1 gnl/TRDRNA2_/TRDRNA2_33103_c0~~gnl/TRDRNA2_/TRDRNA2_33103_c0_seq1.p1  ORF type:complete len:372 (+),score=77.61 gnl/TRDRNA2_/TRDRNA2_33103_c0_seq1:89-1204(+)
MPPSSPKAQRVQRLDEHEVKHRWAGLRKEQREAATRFDDAVLVSAIREAVYTLFEKQVRMMQMGMRAKAAAPPDLFVDSALLAEAFDLPWKIKSDKLQDSVTVDPADQPTWMALSAHILDQEAIFHRFRCVLPDFLGAKTGRFPLPRARWKQLWAVAPSSVAAFEQQLAKLVEQALWAMASNPSFQKPKISSQVEEASPSPSEAVPFEDWMAEPEKGDSKSKKRKKKKKAASELETSISISEELPAEKDPEVIDSAAEVTRSPSGEDSVSQDSERSSVVADEDDIPDHTSEQAPEKGIDIEKVRDQQKSSRVIMHQSHHLLSWSLPSSPWSCGRDQKSGITVVVRNTFIEAKCSQAVHLQRLSRSLSPLRA